MLKNNNQGAVKLIAKRSMKSNRIRNIFALMAVILTTLMLTSVFTIMLSLGKNMNTMQLRLQGTRSSIFINNPDEEQINEVKKNKYVNAVGVYIDSHTAVKCGGDKKDILLFYYDKTEFEKNFSPAIGEITGSYPQKENEIMLSTSSLESLGIKNPQENMEIKLDIAQNSEDSRSSEAAFVLSGWYKDFDSWSGGGNGLVSESYVKALGMSAENNGVMSVSCKGDRQNQVFNDIGASITLKTNQEIKTSFDVQGENSSTMIVVAVVIVLISLIIMLSGYLLIYNVLYISVTKDIRFYGMLKTIGTSPNQIKTIVKNQAFRFLIVGLPVGILLGTAISFVAAPMAMEMFGSSPPSSYSIMPTNITFNPFIYIGTIVFAIITVILSCRKPAKIASSVSPVEALKYNGVKGGGNIKSQKTIHGGKPHRMAFRNVFREKKRAILVFASLFMGTMAFLSVNTFVGCMKIENYIDTYLPNDYTLIPYKSGDEGDTFESEEKLSEAIDTLVNELKNINGMDFVEVCRDTYADLEFDRELYKPFFDQFTKSTNKENCDLLAEMCQNGEYDFSTNVISVSSRMIERYNQKAHDKIDIDAFEKGEIALVGKLDRADDGDSMIGKTIKLTDSDSKKSVDIKVGSVSSDECSYGLNLSNYYYSGISPSYILVSDSVIDRLTDKPSVSSIIADYKDTSGIEAADAKVLEKTKSIQCIKAYDIKNTEISDFKSSMSSLSVLTSGISIVLILIGILNFVNVMLTGVYTRRKELAVLESVGMTRKQIHNMLMFEGLYYAIITILLILTAGNGIMYLVASLAQKIADYAVFFYPFMLMGIIVIFIFIVCIIVPSAVYKAASKESVTERLRDVE